MNFLCEMMWAPPSKADDFEVILRKHITNVQPVTNISAQVILLTKELHNLQYTTIQYEEIFKMPVEILS